MKLPDTLFGMADKPFITEAALCKLGSEKARAWGFQVFPETNGFDLLFVATDRAEGFKPGDRIGVQAKLSANLTVLWQAMPSDRSSPCVHYHAVLVPSASDMFIDLAKRLRISTLEGTRMTSTYTRNTYVPGRIRWYRHEVTSPVWVPPCEVPDLPAGVPAPVQLTKWKIGAIKLCLLGEERGFLMRSDFVEAGISMTRWYKQHWIREQEVDSPLRMQGNRKLKTYVLVPERLPPHIRYPEVTAALRKQALCPA